MSFLPFVVTGIAIGSVYGLAATGLVLTYKTSGIFNFGYGALASVAAYLFYWLHIDEQLNWELSAFISVIVLGPVMGILMERFAVRLAPQRTALKIIGTVGLILVVQGLASIKFGTTTVPVPQYLPSGNDTFRIFGVFITYANVILTVVALVAVLGLYIFFRLSRVGLAMRAVVDDPDLLAMQGTDPARVRRTAWIIGSTFAAMCGVLIVPLVGLDPTVLTFLVVQAFAAAAIGGFSSIPLTYAGGIFVGVAAAVAQKYAVSAAWLSGVPSSLPFIILFAVLLVRGRKLVPLSRVEARPKLQYRAPPRVRVTTAAVAIAALVVIPHVVGSRLPFFTTGLVTVLMLLSLGLLVRMSGQVSLCSAAFAAIGAVAFSQFRLELGLPWLLAFFLGALVAVPVGALVAIPAMRLSGLFLALATFGFGILVQQLLYPQSWMFSTFTQGRAMPHPSFAQSPQRFYYVVLGAVGIASVIVVVIERSRLGRMLRGLGDSPKSVASMGLSINVARVTVFCISAFLAAGAGILLGVSENFATGGDPFFSSFNSLLLLAMLALAPFAEPWYAFVPAISVVVPAYVGGSNTTYWFTALFGISAIVVAMTGGTQPMPALLRRWLDRLPSRRRLERENLALVVATRSDRAQDSAGLVVGELTVKYGGMVAVSDLSLRAPLGKVTGLIGPNGAGKTSTFDACSGLNRRFRGRVLLCGQDITRLAPAARARKGLGRTFQSVELCETLTVVENVRLGDEASRAGFNPLTQLGATRGEWRATRAEAASALEICGISDLAPTQASSLSTGQRRLVELARCLAGPFDFLLLDEPSAGLDVDETTRFGDLLLKVVEQRGMGILLVEHDMSAVMRLCDYIYVMDFGHLIFEGTSDEVARSSVVQLAYLGTDAATSSSTHSAASQAST